MADFSLIKKHIPSEAQEPWLTTANCRVFYSANDGALHLVKDFFPKGYAGPEMNYLGGKDGQVISAPSNSEAIKMNEKLLEQKVEVKTNADGSSTLAIEIYREYFDTGGYMTRILASVDIAADGKLKGFSSEKSTSHKRFFFFGAFGEFKINKSVRCN